MPDVNEGYKKGYKDGQQEEEKFVDDLRKQAKEMRAEIKLLRSGNNLLRKDRDDRIQEVARLKTHNTLRNHVSEGWLRAPVVVAVALALYGYNVSPLERAKKIVEHLHEGKWEMYDVQPLTDILIRSTAYAATELDPELASIYVCQAMEKYGEEAVNRVQINNMF